MSYNTKDGSKQKRITFSLSKDELQFLEFLAAKSNLTVPNLIRTCLQTQLRHEFVQTTSATTQYTPQQQIKIRKTQKTTSRLKKCTEGETWVQTNYTYWDDEIQEQMIVILVLNNTRVTVRAIKKSQYEFDRNDFLYQYYVDIAKTGATA